MSYTKVIISIHAYDNKHIFRPASYIVADFGCGEAKLATSVQQTVKSFDLVALNKNVIACDMANVPLKDNSIDVAVYCLSLMGVNIKDYLLEASRVLKMGYFT